MFSHSGTTPKQRLKGNLMKGLLCCVSPHSSIAFQCPVICAVLSSILFFIFLIYCRYQKCECQSANICQWFCLSMIFCRSRDSDSCSAHAGPQVSSASNLGKVSLAITLFSPDHIISSCQDGDTSWS